MFVKTFQNNVLYFGDPPFQLKWAKSGLIVVENESKLLLAIAVIHDSAPIAEKTLLDGILLEVSGIWTIEKGNESLLSHRPPSNFPSLALMSKSKKLALYLSVFSLLISKSSG